MIEKRGFKGKHWTTIECKVLKTFTRDYQVKVTTAFDMDAAIVDKYSLKENHRATFFP